MLTSDYPRERALVAYQQLEHIGVKDVRINNGG